MSMLPLVLFSLVTEELMAAWILGGNLLLKRALHGKGRQSNGTALTVCGQGAWAAALLNQQHLPRTGDAT
jgi:hypothetical protein